MMIVALFSSEDSRDVPWAAPVKTDYNRRSEFYAEIELACAKLIKLYKDGLRFLDSRFVPFSYSWTKLPEKQKLDILFDGSDASNEFKQHFAQSRFGKKLLNFQADFAFCEVNGADAEISVPVIQGISIRSVKDAVAAATETKGTGEEIVHYLKALFPTIAVQAEVEEQMELAPDEEIDL
jgi:hypothetical protein